MSATPLPPRDSRTLTLHLVQMAGILVLFVLLNAWFANTRAGSAERLTGIVLTNLFLAGASGWLWWRRGCAVAITRGGEHASAFAAALLFAILVVGFGAMISSFPEGLPEVTGRHVQSVLLILLVPLAEELYFRGLLFGWLRTWAGDTMAAVLVSALFGFLHPWLPFGWAMIAWSLVLCFSVVVTRSLWWAIGLHMAWNAWAEVYHMEDGQGRYLLVAVATVALLAIAARGLLTRNREEV